MINKQFNKISICIFSFICILELIFRIYTKENIISTGFVFSIFSALFLSSLLYLITFIFRNKRRIYITINIVFVFLIFLFYLSEIVYYKIFRTFFTFYLMTHGMKAFAFWKDMLLYMWSIAPWIILLIVITIICIKLIIKFSKEFVGSIFNFILCFFSIVIMTLLLIFSKDQYGSSDYAIKHYNPIEAKLEGLGLTFGFCYDAFSNNFKYYDEEQYNNIINKLNSRNISINNSKTGIFKGKNLILVCAESFSPYCIDEKITPTLYKMYNEGFKFNNFYSPLWAGSTADGEFSFLTSLIPKYTGMTIVDTINNDMPYTMAKELNKINYKSFAYHNNDGYYYRRNETYPNLGYNFKGLNLGLNLTKTWPESDEELIIKSIDEYVKEDKFNIFYITVSGHLSYNFITNAMAIKHKNVFNDANLSNNARAYLCANYEVELAMNQLVNRLDKEGKLDDTVICLVPDHFPYGLSDSEYDEIAKHKIDKKFEKYKSCCLLYNSATKGEEINKYCYTIDILPTLLNMFDIKYNTNVFSGYDIFSNNSQLVIFKDKSWINEAGMFYNPTSEYYSFVNKNYVKYDDLSNVEKKYIDNINNKIEGKFIYSKSIIDDNLYRKVK